jgi:hypothetical protein
MSTGGHGHTTQFEGRQAERFDESLKAEGSEARNESAKTGSRAKHEAMHELDLWSFIINS